MLKSYFKKGILEAGCDEAGRGCLAGPVFAAAVILPEGFYHELLNDSKQIKEKDRDLLRPIIEEQAVAWCVAEIDNVEIDEINILKASFKAMHKAVEQLKIQPELLLIDGNRFTPYLGIPHQCIVKGDSLYMSIAAASVLAKTHRDECMMKMHKQYPMYGWDNNKGYGTIKHRRELMTYGSSPFHRKTFKWKMPPEEDSKVS